MAITLGTTPVELNGATAVTVVPAPGAATARVALCIRVFNLDTVVQDITLQSNHNGTKKTLDKIFGLAPGKVWMPVMRDSIKVLALTTSSLELFMGGGPTTTNPHAESEWLDKT
jgi:hypothetical protein